MKRISLTHIVSKVTFLFFGLRGRLLALVLFAAVPAVVITILNAIEERRLLMESKQHALQTLVRTASNDFVDDVRTAGYLLTALSKLPEITEAKQPVCSELLKQFAQQEPRYAAFLIADRRGNGLCGTEPLHTSTNYSDRPYFQKALKSRALVVGQPIIGRASKIPVLPIAHPMLDSEGEVKSVLVAGLKLSWYGETFARTTLITDASFSLWDKEGRILYRYPDNAKWAGRIVPDAGITSEVLRKKGSRIVETTGLDGDSKIYALGELSSFEDPGLTVVIGTSKSDLFKDLNQKLTVTLLILLLVGGIALTAARLFAARSIEKPVERLVEASKRLAAGDLQARIKEPLPFGELGVVAAAFNDAMASLQAQHDAIERQRSFLRQVIDLDRNFIFVKDRQGRFILVNQTLAEAYGATVENLIGKTDADFNPNRDEVEHFRRDDLAAMELLQERFIEEEKFTDAAGKVRWLQTLKRSMIFDDGEPGMVLGVATDITERKRAEQEIRALNADLDQRVQARTDELEQANRELESFSYSVSHDLRAPLRHIQGFGELLAKELNGKLSPKAEHYLKTITVTSQRMSDLIDDLLAFSRMGRAEMRATTVDLQSLVNEVVGSLAANANGRNIQWKISSLPAVQADPAMLKQVVVNLIDNAIKYTRPRDPAIIEVGSAGQEDGQRNFFVRDNGVGFDMKYINKLFGVFQRLHNDKDFPGTGIGLANVRRVIARHGGRTWAEAEIGKGATFYFSLGEAQAT